MCDSKGGNFPSNKLSVQEWCRVLSVGSGNYAASLKLKCASTVAHTFFRHIAVKSNLKWWKTPYIRHRNRKNSGKISISMKFYFLELFSSSFPFLCRLAKNPFISYRAHNKSIIASTQRRIIYKIIFHGIPDSGERWWMGEVRHNRECQEFIPAQSFHPLCWWIFYKYDFPSTIW